MTQKKLENDSEFNELDLDGDGVVSDQEIKPWKQLKCEKKWMLNVIWRGWQWFQ